MINDPYTLVVCLDRSKSANGTLYLDDEKSYDYRNGKYIYLNLSFTNNVLKSEFIDQGATYSSQSWIERVIIAGLDKIPTKAVLSSSSLSSVSLDIIKDTNSFIIRKPGVSIQEQWKITLSY